MIQRFFFGQLALGAIIGLLGLQSAARADDSTDPSSSESMTQEEAPVVETLDGDPEVHSLRFIDRRQVLMRVGLGGKFKDPLGDSKAKATYGATLRWDRPVHDYVTTGLGLSFYSARPEGEFREPAFDISFILKGRYPFQMGKKERKFETEVYVLSEIGLTIWIDSNSLTLDLIGPGWNVGVSLGYQLFINDRIGLLAEVGWIRTEAFFSRGRISILLNQATVRVGPVFPF